MPPTIVVGYDDGEPAERALRRAVEEAKTSGGELVVVSVLELPFNPEGPQSFGALDATPARMIPLVAPPELEQVQEHAKQHVSGEGVEADYLWAVGDPARVIVDAARDRSASVVVVGSHHHSRLGRLFGTDVAGEVKRELDADVIVVE